VPLQNRVLPTQDIVADPGRGLLMGNRGCLHGADRRLGTTRWRSKAWISCVLDFQGRRRDPMPPGRWTALFFFDEAVALAAGHRPCAYCRRRDFLLYADAWGRHLRAPEMDAVLHSQRVESRTRRQRTTTQNLADLPDGAMVRLDGSPALVLGRQVLSPLDLERQFGLLGGDIFHGALTLNQLFSARPMLGHADYRGPLKGLYHCGSGAHPGGGVTGAPGHNAAKAILGDHRALFG